MIIMMRHAWLFIHLFIHSLLRRTCSSAGKFVFHLKLKLNILMLSWNFITDKIDIPKYIFINFSLDLSIVVLIIFFFD